eukprot:scaffold42764_cov60-Attheya_sp.AAC.4
MAEDWVLNSTHMPLVQKSITHCDSEYVRRLAVESFDDMWWSGNAAWHQKLLIMVPRSKKELVHLI